MPSSARKNQISYKTNGLRNSVGVDDLGDPQKSAQTNRRARIV